MPIYSHYYPDDQNKIGTSNSAFRLALQGPLVPVTISPTPQHLAVLQGLGRPAPAPVSGQALTDTGAGLCTVDEQIVQALGIPPFGSSTIYTPSGTSNRQTFPAALSFPGTTLPNLTFNDFVGTDLQMQGFIAIIGRNILRYFVISYNGPGGHITLAS